MTAKGRAALFVERLAQTVASDGEDPEITVVDDSHYEVDDSGRCQRVGTGAEAILVVRGSLEGRTEAIRKLLASVEP